MEIRPSLDRVLELASEGRYGRIPVSCEMLSDVPCAVGFGISRPEQAAAMAAVSDGAIVGSAIVRILARYGKEAAGPVEDYVREMKAAVMGEA